MNRNRINKSRASTYAIKTNPDRNSLIDLFISNVSNLFFIIYAGVVTWRK